MFEMPQTRKMREQIANGFADQICGSRGGLLYSLFLFLTESFWAQTPSTPVRKIRHIVRREVLLIRECIVRMFIKKYVV